MEKWKADSNYMGEDYSEYYVLLTQHRDSEALERSNFRVALDMLGGESKSVIVVRFGHWGVGWVEAILIHESDAEKIAIGNKIQKDLTNYPCLDDDDYYKEQYKEYEDEYESWAKHDAINMLMLTDKEVKNKKIMKALHRAVHETFDYFGETFLKENELKEYFQKAIKEEYPELYQSTKSIWETKIKK